MNKKREIQVIVYMIILSVLRRGFLIQYDVLVYWVVGGVWRGLFIGFLDINSREAEDTRDLHDAKVYEIFLLPGVLAWKSV